MTDVRATKTIAATLALAAAAALTPTAVDAESVGTLASTDPLLGAPTYRDPGDVTTLNGPDVQAHAGTILIYERKRRRQLKIKQARALAAARTVTHIATIQTHATVTSAASAPSTGLIGRIEDCESGVRLPNGRAVFDSRRYNIVNFEGSGAGGAAQLMPRTFQSLGYYGLPQNASPAVQDEAAEKLLERDGTTPWVSSESCWS